MKKILLALLLCAGPAYAQWAPNVPAGTTKPFKFTSRTSSGTPTSLSGGAAACLKAGNTTPSSTGLTLTADYGGLTAVNELLVNLAADTVFYSVNTDITCYLTAGTVGGTSVVHEVIVNFHISSDLTVQKGVAFPNYPIVMQSANGSAVIGITPSCQIQKDNGAFAANANSPVEVASGLYRIDLTASETSANRLTIKCTGTGAATSWSHVTPQQ